jgi:hypothetical protein
MWKMLVAAVIVADVGIATLAWGAENKSDTTDPWMQCYNLGWSRGVHLELGEMPGWIDQCLEGNIPGGPQRLKTNGPERSNYLPHWQ